MVVTGASPVWTGHAVLSVLFVLLSSAQLDLPTQSSLNIAQAGEFRLDILTVM